MLFIYPSPVLLFLAFSSVAVVGSGAIARVSLPRNGFTPEKCSSRGEVAAARERHADNVSDEHTHTHTKGDMILCAAHTSTMYGSFFEHKVVMKHTDMSPAPLMQVPYSSRCACRPHSCRCTSRAAFLSHPRKMALCDVCPCSDRTSRMPVFPSKKQIPTTIPAS